MITRVSIKKVGSYGETPAILETAKKINLIYGLNGAGKTTFSNYLQNRESTSFSDCSISGISNEKILVYNQKFVEQNFYQDTQKGIFSLKSENKEAKEKIDLATETIEKLNKEIKNTESMTGFQFDLEKKQEEIETLQINSEEKIWKIKNAYYGGDRILEFCLEGKIASKKSLFEHISKVQKPIIKPPKTIENLKAEAEATQGENPNIYDESLVKRIDFSFWKIEGEEIFKEVIIGNENSQVAELISKLNISDWVKEGKSFLHKPGEKNETCPFCQQKTISKDFHDEIQNYFDDAYQSRITSLENLESKYWNEYQKIKDLESELLKIDFIKSKETDFKLLFKNFIDKISNNWSKIRNKIKSPNVIFDLESSILDQKVLNEFLNTIVGEIKTHNEKVENKQATRNQIISDFWEIMRWEYDQTIENYVSQSNKLQIEKSAIEAKISDLNSQLLVQRTIIQNEQKEMVNIQDAIDAINCELIYFGLDGFSIVPAGEKSYKLKRPSEDIAKFETLSEGEKTVISFLYFLELCKGKAEDNEVVTEKIIIIDDPISSLSHMYVFNVAQLIKKNFFNDDYKQIFILTHNLYLFHELIKYTERKKEAEKSKLFRITKNQNKESLIFEMNTDEIMNDYQSYWKILKDHDKNMVSDSILANSMRNILEYFFGFIDNDKYEKSIEKLTDGRYSYFLRYINRESHFDRVNISDTKEIDPLIFKDAFKKIFTDSGHEDHYNRMMQ